MRPWLGWGAGLLACIVVMMDVTVLGVSGLHAADRFGARSSVLSSFMVLQIITYGGMQIPAGVLLDRFGPRATVATGVSVASFGPADVGADAFATDGVRRIRHGRAGQRAGVHLGHPAVAGLVRPRAGPVADPTDRYRRGTGACALCRI